MSSTPTLPSPARRRAPLSTAILGLTLALVAPRPALAVALFTFGDPGPGSVSVTSADPDVVVADFEVILDDASAAPAFTHLGVTEQALGVTQSGLSWDLPGRNVLRFAINAAPGKVLDIDDLRFDWGVEQASSDNAEWTRLAFNVFMIPNGEAFDFASHQVFNSSETRTQKTNSSPLAAGGVAANFNAITGRDDLTSLVIEWAIQVEGDAYAPDATFYIDTIDLQGQTELPEPSTALLMATGILGLARAGRRPAAR